ncbi:MAG: hypothetical protein Tsb009_18910 [Planctomycetaceae bacterium]
MCAKSHKAVETIGMQSPLILMTVLVFFLPGIVGKADEKNSEAEYDRILKSQGISPTPEAILRFIRPSSEKDFERLILQLGDPEYQKRDKAMKLLANMPTVSKSLIERAAKSSDAEIRYRVRRILKFREQHDNSNLIFAVLMKIRGRDYRSGVPMLLKLIPRLKKRRLVLAATSAVINIAGQESLKTLRANFRNQNTDVRIAALRAFALVLKEKSIPELNRHLDDEDNEHVQLAVLGELVNLKDRNALTTICHMLNSNNVEIRAGASWLLKATTKKRFGYIAYDQSPARGRAAAKWLAWAKTEGKTARLYPMPFISSAVLTDDFVTVQNTRVINRAHSSTIYSVAFSPDGSLLASCGSDYLVKVWETATGTLAQKFVGHTRTVRCVSFSPQGNILASSSYDKTVKLWNLQTGKLIRTLNGHTNSVRIIAFSPDGKLIASTSSDQTVRIWDVASGKLLKTLKGHHSTTRCVAFSPDGATLASGSSDRTIRLWNVETGELRKTLTGHESSVRSIAFVPDGTTLISGSLDKTLRLWDMASGKMRFTINGHTSSIKCIAISPNGRLFVSVGNDSRVRAWSVESGKQITNSKGHTSSIWHVAFSPDNKTVASCGSDGSIRLWNIIQKVR